MMLFAQSTAALRKIRYSVRVHLMVVVVVVLVPALILTYSLATWSARSERAQLEQSAHDQAREATSAIERDIIGTQNVLATLAGSPFLQSGDIEAFYGQAADVSRKLGLQVVLRDRRLDRQVVNTTFPWGTALTGGTQAPLIEAEEELLRFGKPVVSRVFFGPLIKEHVVAVIVPVFRGSNLRFSLAAGVPLKKFAEILGSLDIRHDQIVSVVDRTGIFVARSEKHTDFAGTQAANTLPPGIQSVINGINREGLAFHWFNRRSDVLGWSISVGVPDRLLAAPRNRAIASAVTASSLLLAVAIALSYHWGGRLSRSFGALGIDRKPTREEFEVLFDAAPNGVMVIGGDGVIMLANERMEKKFGYPRGELVGKPVEMMVPERFRSGHSELRKAFMHAPSARAMGAGRDLFGLRKDGTEFPVEIGLSPIVTQAGSLVMATVVDITKRKHAEESLSAAVSALRTSEELRRFAIEAAEIGTWNWDVATDERWWSDRFKELIGVPPTTIPNRETFLSCIHPSDRPVFEELRERSLAENGRYELEVRVIGTNGGPLSWICSKGSVDFDESGRPVRMQGVVQDITARKEAERTYADLRRRMEQTRDEERSRLARELHDQTGQSLTAAMLELKGIENLINGADRHRLRLLRLQLEHLGETLHHVAWELRPASIDELGLASAIGTYISEWSEQYSIDVDFHCVDLDLDELADESRTTLYRVVQEALTNIAKHARETMSVSIVIERVNGTVRLIIEDDGCGFDSTSQKQNERNRGGLGLAGMRERLSLVGGQLEIESSMGIGTTVFASIPLEHERSAA